MRASYQPFGDILAANNPKLRLFTVPKLKANEPVDNVKSAWDETSPASVSNFSAVAYYFGMKLQKDLGVPVGMIHTSWGGSPAEVWMRDGVLGENPEYKRDIVDVFQGQLEKFEKSVAQWEQEKADAAKAGKEFKKGRPWGIWKPGELYNGMIAPLIPYAIKGAIWYQGESNADRAGQYRRLLPAMIRDWRKQFGEGNFPFYIVSLANFQASNAEPRDNNWAELREAQVLTAKNVPNCGLALAIDIGDAGDIHPKNKQEVGRRLALCALAQTYGKKVEYSGPWYRSMKVNGNKIALKFDHVDGGLVAKGGKLTGFAIAGADHKFVWADAAIDGKTVVVSSPEIAQPVAVRYAWDINPVCNLYNQAGLPAVPFRTDDWPPLIQPAK